MINMLKEKMIQLLNVLEIKDFGEIELFENNENLVRIDNEEYLVLDEEEREAASNPDIVDVKKSTLFTCIENQLAQDNNAVNFNFHNDWINGMLYAPLWYRKITPKNKSSSYEKNIYQSRFQRV